MGGFGLYRQGLRFRVYLGGVPTVRLTDASFTYSPALRVVALVVRRILGGCQGLQVSSA